MKDLIQKTIVTLISNPDIRCMPLPMHPVGSIEKVFESMGFAEAENVEIDRDGCFYCCFTHPHYGKYNLTGGLWFGKFEINKEE